MKQSEAMRLMNKLAAFFPPVPVESAAAYASEISSLEAGTMELAVDSLISTARRFPPLADVLNAYRFHEPNRYEPSATTFELPILDQPTGEYLGRAELARRYRRLRVGLASGLKGTALLEFTEQPQACDKDAGTNAPLVTVDETDVETKRAMATAAASQEQFRNE